jgi:hypothetical protein
MWQQMLVAPVQPDSPACFSATDKYLQYREYPRPSALFDAGGFYSFPYAGNTLAKRMPNRLP